MAIGPMEQVPIMHPVYTGTLFNIEIRTPVIRLECSFPCTTASCEAVQVIAVARGD